MGRLVFDKEIFSQAKQSFIEYKAFLNLTRSGIPAINRMEIPDGLDIYYLKSSIPAKFRYLDERANDVINLLNLVETEMSNSETYVASEMENLTQNSPLSVEYSDIHNAETIGNSNVSVSIQETINLPSNYGKVHTYTTWNKQGWLYDSASVISALDGQNYSLGGNIGRTDYGIVTYGKWFAAATTSTFGKPGDMLLFVQDDNSVYPVMIADIKNTNDAGANKWGHYNGQCVAEFEVLSGSTADTKGNVPGPNREFSHHITSAIKVGNIYDHPELINNVEAAIQAANLSDAKFISTDSI